MSAVEINIPIFERNLKVYNGKGLRRSYTSVEGRYKEYLDVKPLASTTKVVLEATLDKEYVEAFQKLLSDSGYKLLGSTNTYHMENFLNDYEVHKERFKDREEQIEKVREEMEGLKAKNTSFFDLPNDDVKFYFLPYNEDVSNLYEFIKSSKDAILDFAKTNDITIMLKVCPFTTQMDGFIGFNFYDADQKGEVVVDYAARLTVGVDFNKFVTAYQAAVLLTGIGESKEELADPDLNVHIFAENIIYKQA